MEKFRMRAITLLLCALFTPLITASDAPDSSDAYIKSAFDIPDSIDAFFDNGGIAARFVNFHDPGFIRIKLENGELIDTTYSEIDFETLFDEEQKDEGSAKRGDMMITYSIADGVMVKDINTGKIFSLNGVIEYHPIDWAMSQCKNRSVSTMSHMSCKGLELDAWDAELNRAYKALGGSKNLKLKKAQLAWIKFRDAQNEYFRSVYSSRQGTIWGLVSMDHVISTTRNQAEQLQSVLEW